MSAEYAGQMWDQMSPARTEQVKTLHPQDLAAVQTAWAEAEIMSGMTKGQRARQRVRWMVERGEFTGPQLEILCSCAKPNCVVHAREYKP